MIAMMLIAEPDLLIADEPTSALDVTVQLQVLAILDELVTERGMGLIFISHDLHLVASFCDRVLVMYAGRVVEELAARRPRPRRSTPTRAGLLACLPQLDGDRAAAADARPRPGLGAGMSAPIIEVEDAVGRASASAPTRRGGRRRVASRVADGRELRPRRRIRLGQVDGAARARRPQPRLDRRRSRIDGEALRRSAATRPSTRAVQMVFQDPYGSLHPRQTVDRMLAEPLAIHGIGDAEARIERGAATRSASARPSASATRTSSPAASASASRSPAR